MSKMTMCNTCKSISHTYSGKCTCCGKRKNYNQDVTQIESSFTDDDRMQVVGFLSAILILTIVGFAIAIAVATLG